MQNIESIYISGVFVRELKNRFLCEVKINGKVEECYVPSSCHLSNFLQLEGKRVLLIPTQTPNSRTKYALFAVPFKKNYIVLNTSMSNRAIEDGLQGRHFSYLGKRKKWIKEHKIDGYKADLYIPSTKTIIEIKSIISLREPAIFPTVYSERTINQLRHIQQLLLDGYRVCFFIVSLHPYVKAVTIDKNSEFYIELSKCLSMGLVVKAYTSRLKSNVLSIDKEISLNYQ